MSQPIHILLIEDDDEDYMITRDIVEEIPDRRYRLDWAASFEEGIAAIENKQYDVYLLDYRLGKEDGVELLRQVDAPSLESPFILLTGQDDIALDKEAMEAGAVDFLIKGEITAGVLERTIRYAIQHRKTILKLQRSQKLLKEAQKLAHIGHFDWDFGSDEFYWSDEMYRIYGYEPQSFEVTFDTLYSHTHPDDLQLLQNFIEKVKKEKIALSFGYRIVTAQKETRHVYGVREIEFDRKGKMSRLFGTLRDVTEQKKREEELRIKDMAISSSPLPIAFADLDNKFTFINQAFLDLWGYKDSSEILGQPTFDFGKNPERVKEIMESIQHKGQWIGEDTAKKKDGSVIDIYVTTSLVKDESGIPICTLGTFLDITEQKRAQAYNEDISKIVEESLNEIFIFAADTLKFIQVNQGGRQNLGYTQEELREITPIEIKPEFTKKKFVKTIQPLLDGTKEKLIFYTIHERKDKTTYSVEIHLQYASLGGQAVFVAFVSDITEQRESELAIQKEKETAQMYLDIAGSIVVVIDKDEQISLLNQRGEEILGLSAEEVIGKNWYDLVVPQTEREEVRQIFNRLMDKKGKNVEYYENSISNKNGEKRLIWWHNRVLFDDKGDAQGTISSGVDITELRKTEQELKESQRKIEEYSQELEQKVIERTTELRESELKLTEAQSIAKMGHWDYFPLENKLTFSKGMYQIFGIKSNEVITYELINALTHPDDLEWIKDEIKKAVLNKKGISVNHRIITPNKTLKYVRSNVQPPSFDENGQVIRIFGVLKDITTLKESELQLHEALNREKELGILKSRFVSMASHEFRTPLSSILSSAELLGMYIEAGKLEKTGKNIKRIKTSVRNLTNILKDFLSLEKLEAGKVEVQNTEIQLKDYLAELSEEIQPILRPDQQLLLQFKNIPVIQTDPYLLKNILINLLSNAIKYSPKGEDVTLEISKGKNQLIFKVIDQGIGIPDEDKQHMFSRFFRASNVENIKGTGLGLTIVKRYLDLMGGGIDFKSEYGKGSTFFFKLPA